MEDDHLEELLNRCREGDVGAFDELFVNLMPNLKVLARSYLRGHHVGVTQQTTALLHDLFLRLRRRLGGRLFSAEKTTPILARLAQEMRNLIMDQVRAAGRSKKGGAIEHLRVDEGEVVEVRCAQVEALDQALEALRLADEQAYFIFILRERFGLTAEETAETVKISKATLFRDAQFAKTFLRAEMHRVKGSGGKYFVRGHEADQ